MRMQKLNPLKYLIVFILLLLTWRDCYSQLNVAPWDNKFVRLNGKVVTIDSQYYLVLNLSISGNEKIKLNKIRYYGEGNGIPVGIGRLYFQKQVRSVYVNVSSESLSHPMYDSDWEKLVVVDQNHPIIDSVLLDNKCPLEIGEYRLHVELDYFYKTKKYTANTDFIDFSVPFIPPKSIYK